jgi:beta-lactam-binding protein with PASTA domain/tRNA A-37 threonylcarbamoyl transferase component Bud32
MANLQDTLIDALFDGRYRIKRRLGAGGMANVYLAEDTELGRPVAIKILNERYATDELFVERFRREAKSAAALSHPNIVSIYDRGEADGTYYIAMEVVEGTSLKELIRRSGRLRPAQAVAYARLILSALRVAHRNGIIHRDIKPHNILVGPEGHVKVTDFGIARAGAASQMTEVGSVMGTAQYLSPEQARGGEVSAASDLYSLGVVLYEMLTGDVPFTGDTHVEIAMKHVQDPPRPPSERAPGIGPALDHVVLRALAKNPADRYQSAEEFDRDLARVEAGLPVASETADAATQVLRGASSAPTQVLGRPQPRPSGSPPSGGGRRPPYDPYGRPRRKRSVLPWLIALILLVALAGGGYYAYTQIHDRILTEAPVAVPSVEGIKEQLAVKRLRADGFDVKIERRNDAKVAVGFVIDQDPEPGVRIARGDTVTIVVSLGVEQVTVPKVVGLDQTDAAKQLQDAGLELGKVRAVFSPNVKPGVVIRQSPAPNEKVPKGSPVDLVVSRGVEQVAVPNVIGKDQATATAELHQAGFEVDPQTQNSDQPQGVVIDQQPNGGQAPKGSTVTIVVSAGPQLVTVPGVIGQDEATATATLSGAGFHVVTRNQSTFDPAENGVVINQDPPARSQRLPGSTVTIYVGRFQGGPTTQSGVPGQGAGAGNGNGQGASSG